MSIKNIKIRFNMDKENDRKAYEYLTNSDMSYSKTVIDYICKYIELSEVKSEEDAFLERIISTIKFELSNVGTVQVIKQDTVEKNNDEAEDNILDFLDAF